MQNGDTVVHRPWGHYFKLYQEAGVWVKRVMVEVGGRLSLQEHYRRSEKWIIVKGQGLAVVDEKEFPLNPGSVLDIPAKAKHRIGNSGKEPLVFIEVACGEYLGEDDIKRLEDDYRR